MRLRTWVRTAPRCGGPVTVMPRPRRNSSSPSSLSTGRARSTVFLFTPLAVGGGPVSAGPGSGRHAEDDGADKPAALIPPDPVETGLPEQQIAHVAVPGWRRTEQGLLVAHRLQLSRAVAPPGAQPGDRVLASGQVAEPQALPGGAAPPAERDAGAQARRELDRALG